MYLSELQIRNFRNHYKTRLKFEKGSNTIIGENDVGKSNMMLAIRMLLDNSYYLSVKNIDKSDFSDFLGNWKGHWIIISATFKDISEDEISNEDIASIAKIKENAFLSSEKISTNNEEGKFTLFIRPNIQTRNHLSSLKDKESFNEYRSTISVNDYEIYYSSRSDADFLDDDVYLKIVGDIENNEYLSGNYDNQVLLGSKSDARSFQEHISVVMIDALRDVESEMRKRKNPLNTIINSIQTEIPADKKSEIGTLIDNLNLKISSIDNISEVGSLINETLTILLGNIFSPNIVIQSQMNSNIEELSKFIALKSQVDGDLDRLGLGHLNMIYVALKMVEFEMLRNREVLNILLIEEPEAHIHHNIQRTLFSNINNKDKYTQVIMTTHSTHISEASEISRMNILVPKEHYSYAVQPSNKLDLFGVENSLSKNRSFTKSIERYLDSKRSTLLFSKSVILVEGDGEEILIPTLIKNGLGIDMNELGINIVNVGNVYFQYIASLFHEDRIHKNCSIITDLDQQAVKVESTHYKKKSEDLGAKRNDVLKTLYGDNKYVKVFTNPHTFEIEFFKEDNVEIFKTILKEEYSQQAKISKYLEYFESSLDEKAEAILTLASRLGKGWFAIKILDLVDHEVVIPDYILQAFNHASFNIITKKDIEMMMYYYVRNKGEKESSQIHAKLISEGLNDEVFALYKRHYPHSNLQRFLNIGKKYVYES